MKSFVGGVHPKYCKLTDKALSSHASIPEKIFLPLRQHIGAVLEPIVKKGSKVGVGQKIAESKAFISAPIHSPVAGKVEEIKLMPSQFGQDLVTVIIKPDKQQYNPFKKKIKNPDTSPDGIIKAVHDAGIVGMGGAMFPTHVKLLVPKEKKVDTVILNGCECEPYITADAMLMQEHAGEVVDGLKLIMKSVGAKNAIIGIEDNKKSAIRKIIKTTDDKNIKVVKLKSKYPQGAEKTLIHSVLKRRVPSGGLPMDVGVVVNNVATAKAVYDAVYFGRPLIERLITVTGVVKQPSNLWVKLGTPMSSIIKDCKGYGKNPHKLVVGGPMLGISLESDDFPIIKGNNGILVQSEIQEINNLPSSCIRCSKCIDVCPMNLVPIAIASFAEKGDFEGAKNVHAMDCFDCGACSFVCPQRIAVSDFIKKAKEGIKR